MERYSRQVRFAKIGISGQERLANKHVLLVGAGALGSGNAENLARAGVGKITIVDRDYVEWSNLGRQQLYTEQDVRARMPKAIAAEKRLRDINSSIQIQGIVTDVSVAEIESLTKNVDLILDATDNFDTRMPINDIAHKKNVPWIYGACVGSYGLSYTILPGKTPCLHCLLSTVPLGGVTCDTAGIIAPTVQMVVAHQSVEALKILSEDTYALRQKLVSFDLWENQYSTIKVDSLRKTDCLTCGEHPTHPFLQVENQMNTAILCGRDTVQVRPAPNRTFHFSHVATSLEQLGKKVEVNPYLLSFEAMGHRVVLFKDGRALIHGTKNIESAKKIYHQYVGV